MVPLSETPYFRNEKLLTRTPIVRQTLIFDDIFD